MKPASAKRNKTAAGRPLKRRSLLGLLGSVLFIPTRVTGSALVSHVDNHAAAGRWKFGTYKRFGNLFDLKFAFADGTHDHNQFPVSLPQLVGLAGPLSVFGSTKRFEIRRDAGTFVCTGKLSSASGSGSATFLPNAAYAEELRTQGFPPLSSREQLDFAMFDISPSIVAQCRSIFGDIEPSDVLTITALKVPLPYAAAMRAVVHTATPKDILSLRAFKMSSEEAAAFERSRGERPFTANDIITLKIAGVDPQYVADLNSVGYGNFSAVEITVLHTNNVNASFIREAGAAQKHLSAAELGALKTNR